MSTRKRTNKQCPQEKGQTNNVHKKKDKQTMSTRKRSNKQWPQEKGQTNNGYKKKDKQTMSTRKRTNKQWPQEKGQIVCITSIFLRVKKNPTREFYRNKCKPLQKEHPDIIYQLKQ
jgi:hypothetical protein